VGVWTGARGQDDMDEQIGCGSCKAWSTTVCDRFRGSDTTVLVVLCLVQMIVSLIPGIVGALLLVRKEYSEGSDRTRLLWIQSQVRQGDCNHHNNRNNHLNNHLNKHLNNHLNNRTNGNVKQK
jgi:hypothetical protein